jgi:hypothetical protein
VLGWRASRFAARRARSYRRASGRADALKRSPTRRVFPTRSRDARRASRRRGPGAYVRLQGGKRHAGRELPLQPDVLLSHGLARGTSVGRRRRLGPDVHAPVLDPQRPRRRRRRRRAILLVHKKRWYYACISPRGGRRPHAARWTLGVFALNPHENHEIVRGAARPRSQAAR